MKKKATLRLVKTGFFINGAITIMIALSDYIINQYIKFAFKIDAPVNQASSIGIIGGADGPTAIFIAENQSFSNKYIWMLFFSFITGICFLLWKKTSKDN